LVNATVNPIQTIDAAIEDKDGRRFAEGYKALTDCNACHVGTGRAYVIQVPTASPLSTSHLPRSTAAAMNRSLDAPAAAATSWFQTDARGRNPKA
jgi:hypothetical protein